MPAALVGLHMKALRTAGIDPDRIRHLKRAYGLLSARGPALDDSLDKLARVQDPLVDELIAFVRGSTRGYCRFRRTASRRPSVSKTAPPPKERPGEEP